MLCGNLARVKRGGVPGPGVSTFLRGQTLQLCMRATTPAPSPLNQEGSSSILHSSAEVWVTRWALGSSPNRKCAERTCRAKGPRKTLI
jgi:hypothetical protein